MTTVEDPWEPPFAGTEAAHLTGALDRLRATFRWKADGLDPAGLSTTVGRSGLTIGGLLKHLAFVEDYTFTTKLRGESPGEPWADFEPEVADWDFVSAADDSPERLYARFDDAVARSRAPCAGWSSTSSKSTAAAPGTPTCSVSGRRPGRRGPTTRLATDQRPL